MVLADRFFTERPYLGREMCLIVGRQFFKRAVKKDYSLADGFRRMAYIVALQRR